MIGSGPNGLSAAIELARNGLSVTVYEGEQEIGGGVRSAALTLPGFTHDICSAVYPLAVSSPFFRTLPLERFGLEWIQPPAPVAHPFDRGPAAILERNPAALDSLGADADAWREWMSPLVADWPLLADSLLGPPRIPRHPLALARFGMAAMLPAAVLARRFRGESARALVAGLAAHAVMPLERPATGGFALVLGITAHASGWPIARGGAQTLSAALAACLRSLGGEIITGRRIESLDELPRVRALMCDVTPRQFLRLAGGRLPRAASRRLELFRYGPAAFKLDWALDGPIPWNDEACARAGTVHLGGTLDEIAASERASWERRYPEDPFVLLSQPSLFDPLRAPAGKHSAWAYCHVPNAGHAPPFDMTERIEAQVERFAPGFRRLVIARHVMTPAALERHNPNCVGGDISGGSNDLRQLLLRPNARFHSTALPGVYLCSSSTPPGGGVHGMCGYHAARAALKRL